ncbi:MAG: carboxypeptidase regulatory-like domain-containing protein [Planctomycetota bacterium]|jgi:ribosomal protein S12
MRSKPSFRFLLFASVACMSAAGCNSGRLKTYPIQGKVVFADGSPVKVGTVETKSVDHGVQATGNINLDGTFTLTTYNPNDGAVAGQHRCVVIQFIQLEEIPNYRPSTMGVVNRKHSMYSTSELSFTVKPGEANTVQLVVQGADPILRSTDDHGHEPVPEEPKDQKSQ